MKNEKIVYRKNNKWFTGKINAEGKLRKGIAIKKMSDVKNIDDYITLKKYIKENKKSFTSEEILKNFGVESLYVRKIVEEKTSLKDTIKSVSSKEYWKKRHPLCLKCKNKCKQSSRVIIVNCNYVKIKEK